jgi:hypothetical protein
MLGGSFLTFLAPTQPSGLTLSPQEFMLLRSKERDMPDLDIVARNLRKPWRAAYQLMKGGSSPDIVAESLVKALTTELREGGGLPGFELLLAACNKAQSERGSMKTLAEVIRGIEQRFEQHQSVKLLARTVQKNFAEIEAGRVLPGPDSLVREHLQSVTRHHFFSRMGGRLIGQGKRFANIQEARDFEKAVWSSAGAHLAEIVRSLLSDPTASGLRAPKSRRRLRTTAEIIDAPIVDGI